MYNHIYNDTKQNQRNMKEAANCIWSVYLLTMIDTLLLSPSLHFTPLSYTYRHFTSSYLNFTQLHFTTLSFGLIPFKFRTSSFHLTSLQTASESRCEIPGKCWNVYGEDRLDRSCEKWSIKRSKIWEEYPKDNKRSEANCMGHILRRNCLRKHTIEVKIKGRIEVRGRRGIRRKQLLDDLKEKRRYWKFKEESPDLNVWRTGFGRG